MCVSLSHINNLKESNQVVKKTNISLTFTTELLISSGVEREKKENNKPKALGSIPLNILNMRKVKPWITINYAFLIYTLASNQTIPFKLTNSWWYGFYELLLATFFLLIARWEIRKQLSRFSPTSLHDFRGLRCFTWPSPCPYY